MSPLAAPARSLRRNTTTALFVAAVATACAARGTKDSSQGTGDNGPADAAESQPDGAGGQPTDATATATDSGHPGGGSGGSGSSGSSGGGAGSSGGGPGGEGGGAASHCTNGVQDADETGVDCGGADCPSCTVSYRINPPNTCDNQFFPSGCTSGNASSTCGGVCQPRNACEGDTSKTGPIGFVCPRFMLFSAEMAQAASDDAKANGWTSPDNPPFNYGVVGHDVDTGGLDSAITGSNACCECYQLVFDAPNNEYDMGVPAPKAMIVQAFNTAAGGPQNFDIFMGVGGFGANDACVAEPEGGIYTSPYQAFMYDAFPPDNEPGGGGIKFLDYSQCKDTSANGAATATSIQSAACQDEIGSRCNVVTSSASVTLTNTTRTSCIQSNQLDSLYHQNWKVLAKRVACPDSLTRVTGCKLAPESGLPAPDPSATTKATADASFKTGYTTTTMQDCCKPTCAWANNVGGAGGGNMGNKNSLTPWTSFYSCDKNGDPMTQ